MPGCYNTGFPDVKFVLGELAVDFQWAELYNMTNTGG